MEEGKFESGLAQVALPLPGRSVFTYESPRAHKPGVRVRVPFGARVVTGVLIGAAESLDIPRSKVKAVREVLDDAPLLSENMLRFLRWVAKYYHASLGELCQAALPEKHRDVTREFWELTELGVLIRGGAPDDEHEGRLASVFESRVRLSVQTLRRKIPAKEFKKIRKFWLESGWIKLSFEETTRRERARAESTRAPELCKELTPEQRAAFEAIVGEGCLKHQGSRPVLLHGVTGSGKTEIYLQLIEALFGQDETAQILVLVPEIALTPQTIKVFAARFPGMLAVSHSGLSTAQKSLELRKIFSGEARILVGARSAVFAAFSNLRLIVVDEEHDSSFKQTVHPCYHGRDAAIKRAHIEGAGIVLGSATPALETYTNATSGRFAYVHLPGRALGQELPPVELVDTKLDFHGVTVTSELLGTLDELPGEQMAPQVIEAIEGCLECQEQALIIVGRRGFSYYLIDDATGEPLLCPNCSISLTVHKRLAALHCHYCDFRSSTHKFLDPDKGYRAVGLGSEQLEAQMRTTLPHARIARLDSDITGKAGALEETLSRFRAREIDILVGTQILAKGHDFPKVSLMVILAVDAQLAMPDFRAGERCFQLLVQAAGRAGRGRLPARVMVQSVQPDHPVMHYALEHDYVGFAKEELELREVSGFPPYRRMIQFVWSSEHEERLDRHCARVTRWLRENHPAFLKHARDLRVVGPLSPKVDRIRNRFRRNMLLSCTDVKVLHWLADSIEAALCPPSGVHQLVDVDPLGLI